MDATKTIREFNADALIAFHMIAKDHGMAEKGRIYIPELDEMADDFLLTMLKDETLISMCKEDIEDYYLLLTRIAFNAGIAFADKWHMNFAELQDGSFMEFVKHCDIMEYVRPAIEKEFHKTKEEWNDYERELFRKWLELINPYWKLDDCRDQIMIAYRALFQLGVSTILVSYGY